MQNPLQVTFHDLPHNKEIEDLIDEKFEKLKMMSPDITKCHVVLEKQSKHHQKANTAYAKLDLKVSHFEDIVMSEKCTEDHASLKTAISKIFKRVQTRVREGLLKRKGAKRLPLREKFIDQIEEDNA